MNEYSTALPHPAILISLLLLAVLILLLPYERIRERRRDGTHHLLRGALWTWLRTPRRERFTVSGLRRVQWAIIALVAGVWALGQVEAVGHLWRVLKGWLGW
ncbi:MAG: hypothetical protein OHK0022_49080 [Roseiflexaceae bacterium]